MSRKHRENCYFGGINPLAFGGMNQMGYGGGNCACSLPTLIILILILLQFNRRRNVEVVENDDCDCDYDCEIEEHPVAENSIVDEGILFIIALFFLSCSSKCYR